MNVSFHEVERVENLMYEGCEPHWHCIHCNDYWPFHCYGKKDLERMACPIRSAQLQKDKARGVKQMADREVVIEQLESMRDYHRSVGNNITADIANDALALLKEKQEIVRCKDCKWYDERISMCDNCGLPREQTFFCADGKRR